MCAVDTVQGLSLHKVCAGMLMIADVAKGVLRTPRTFTMRLASLLLLALHATRLNVHVYLRASLLDFLPYTFCPSYHTGWSTGSADWTSE